MQNDLTIYSRFAHEWWIDGAPRFRSLQNLTPFRLTLIEELMGDLSGKKVLDLGCGGGLIAVPLLNKGVKVVGIDISEESINAAKVAAKGRGEFIVGDISSIDIPSHYFDYVLIADVLDHIPKYATVLSEASRLLRPGGKLFVGTLNRTLISRLLTIVIGESLRLIPKGTHAYDLFIKPTELIEAAKPFGLSALQIQGEWPLFFKTIGKRAITLRKSKSLSVAYSVVFEKDSNEK